MIVIDENERPQQIPGKPNSTEMEGCFVDDFCTIPITLWNEQIDLLKVANIMNSKHAPQKVQWKTLLVLQHHDEDKTNQHS